MHRFWRRLAIVLAVLFAGLAGWFLLADLSWFEEHCPDCHYSRTDVHYRLLTVPVHTWEERRPTALQAVARDLDVRCQHPKLHRWHKQRRWGLLVCYCPCHNGIVGLAFDETWYDAAASEKLNQLAKADPSFANNFHQRVLVEHDDAYWHEIRQQITQPEPLTSD